MTILMQMWNWINQFDAHTIVTFTITGLLCLPRAIAMIDGKQRAFY